MRHRFALLVALASLAFATGAAARDCRRHALDALRDAPDGASVYARLSDKTFFHHWIDCDDPTLGLPTAIHESVHFITSETDAFPLVGGGDIQRPHEVSQFYAPSRIAGSFEASEYADTYLKPGRASSSKDFLFLLDELNAYTHDLNAAVDLKGMRRADRYTDSRDGLAALMAFVALYVEHARASEPATWEGLREPAVARAMATLWGHAEKAMAASCGLPNFGTRDKAFLRQAYGRSAQAALTGVIGRAPATPDECLKASDEDTMDQAEVVEPAPTKRTIWSRRTVRAAPVAANDDEPPNQ